MSDKIRIVTKDDIGSEATIQDLRRHLLWMVQALSDFCDRNGIRYYMSGGTLLGAVRHRGFIPWDDDIDLNIPRPDCEKLQELSKGIIEGEHGRYVLQRPSPIPDSVAHAEFWRFYDYSMVIENYVGGSSKKAFYEPVFIDIFPIEGLPSDDKELVKHYKKITFTRFFMFSGLFNPWKGSNLTRKIAHLIAWPIAKIITHKRLYNRIQKIATSYDFDKCEHIGVVTAPVHTTQERVKKSEYIPQVDLDFEGLKLHGPQNYDTYLTQLYGKDYMQLPPEEKRKSHHAFKLYFSRDAVNKGGDGAQA